MINIAENFGHSLRLEKQLTDTYKDHSRRKYSYGSAIADTEETEGKLKIRHYGVVTQLAVEFLERSTLDKRLASRYTVTHFEDAATTWGGVMFLDRKSYPDGLPVSAVICRDDQLDRSEKFCRMLAQCGIMASCWTPGHLRHAHEWLEEHCWRLE